MLAYDKELHDCYCAYLAYIETAIPTPRPMQSYKSWRQSDEPLKEAFVFGWMSRREYGLEPGYNGDEATIREH